MRAARLRSAAAVPLPLSTLAISVVVPSYFMTQSAKDSFKSPAGFSLLPSSSKGPSRPKKKTLLKWMTIVSFEVWRQVLDGAGAKPHLKCAIALRGKRGYWLSWSHVAHEFDQRSPRVSHWFHKPQLPGNFKAFSIEMTKLICLIKAEDFISLHCKVSLF